MLGKIADFYEDEVDASIQSLTSIVEPIMMIGVGIMVGDRDHQHVPADVQAADADQVARARVRADIERVAGAAACRSSVGDRAVGAFSRAAG